MKPLNPVSARAGMGQLQFQVQQKVHEVLSGNVDMGQAVSKDASGVYNGFEKGNSSGVLIRVGASGSSETVKWTTSGTGVVINHGLLRQPIGFKIVDKDKTVDCYRTATPDATQITIAPTDATANVTLYIF